MNLSPNEQDHSITSSRSLKGVGTLWEVTWRAGTSVTFRWLGENNALNLNHFLSHNVGGLITIMTPFLTTLTHITAASCLHFRRLLHHFSTHYRAVSCFDKLAAWKSVGRYDPTGEGGATCWREKLHSNLLSGVPLCSACSTACSSSDSQSE